jgi:hypothetical protein
MNINHCRPKGENLTPLKVLLDKLLKDFYCSNDFMSPGR